MLTPTAPAPIPVTAAASSVTHERQPAPGQSEPNPSRSRRILLATSGSLGDLHPYLAVGLELQRRGHRVTVASAGGYGDKVRQLGLDFIPVRPHFPDPTREPEAYERLLCDVMDRQTGTERILREWVMPHLRNSWDDLQPHLAGVDLIITHPLTYAAMLAAEKHAIPWLSVVLAPLSCFSMIDPPVLPKGPQSLLRYLPPWINQLFLGLMRRMVNPWCQPYYEFRRELGLPDRGNPLFEGQFSPYGTLALFSPEFGAPQRDWPTPALVTGFPFYDQHENATVSPELEAFLQSGPPPVIVTLGSSAVMAAGDFYRESVAAVRQLGQRAVLLVGKRMANRPAEPGPDLFVADYAPYSALLPRGSVTVHQGGVGTTGQALASGRPMLVVPFAHDQPDNAARACRLGVARSMRRERYNARSAAAALRDLLTNPVYGRRAAEIGERVRRETGAPVAADAIERVLSGQPLVGANR